MSASVKEVSFITSNNKRIAVPWGIATKSITIKNMLEDIGDYDAPIPLPNVNSQTLKWIVAYYSPETRPQNKEMSLKTMTIEKIAEITTAANYLDCPELLTHACSSLAAIIKNKTPEQIRELLGIENDFTPEEMAEMRDEMEWTITL